MKSSNYKVSIITVSRNSVKTIEQTIRSVLHQTYKNIEYIVIDGASTDGTQQIIEKYRNDISFYVSEEDNGLYYAMNKGLKMATGDIVGIINSDDWYNVNAVKYMVNYFEKSMVDLLYGLTVVVSENGAKKLKSTDKIETIWYQAPFQHPSVFVRKKVYDRYGGFNVHYRVASDYDLLLRFYSEKVKFAYLDKVIAYFRLGGLSSIKKQEGCRENYNISMSYIDKCPCKEYTLPKIKETYEWSCFKVELQMTSGIICNLLRAYFNRNITTISIFGTGIWAENCYQNLQGSDMEVLCFSDNNMTKWGTTFRGIKVISPQELKETNVPILVAVREAGNTIKNQLQSMEILKSNCVTLKELRQVFSKLAD